MFKRILISLLFGVCFAIPASLLWAVDVQATIQTAPNSPEDCQECHSITHTHWSEGAHGQAFTDTEFQKAWVAEGSPDQCLSCHTTGLNDQIGAVAEDGVSCIVCHDPVPEDHPDSIMPTDISSRMCGDCHVDTYKDWEMSVHSESDLTCVRCHDSHSASLKKASASETCETCHRENVHFLPYSAHGGTDLECVDCHLQVTDSSPGEGHGSRQHSLVVSLEVCADCHAEEMHAPIMTVGLEPIESGLIPGIDNLYEEPPVNFPFQIILVAALVGMAAGLILAPWLEKLYIAKQAVRWHDVHK